MLILILVAWYIGTMPGHINPLLLPPPAPVFKDFWVLLTTSGIWPDLWVTVHEWIVAVAIAAIAGCSLGYIISRSAYAVRVFDPLLAGIYSIPAILLFPLYLLFFGLGAGSKIAIGTTIASFRWCSTPSPASPMSIRLISAPRSRWAPTTSSSSGR